MIKGDEVFRNQLIQRAIIVKKEDFDKVIAKFSSAEDPITRASIGWMIQSSQFSKIEDTELGLTMFKKAAAAKI